MHQIGYLTYRKTNTTPKKILNELDQFAYDPHETLGYHMNMVFHERPIYKNKEEAYRAIERLDRGFYDDHAVVYRDGRKLMWLVKYEFHC